MNEENIAQTYCFDQFEQMKKKKGKKNAIT
jgi:hypothetical protein